MMRPPMMPPHSHNNQQNNNAPMATMVFVTCTSAKEAGLIAETVVNERLVACVNMIPGVKSFYIWESRLCKEEEILLLMKTESPLLSRLETRVRQLHSAKIPEFLCIPIPVGSKDYLRWLSQTVQKVSNQ